MTQIDHQGATTAKVLPLGPGNSQVTPAGDGTFLAFMGQTSCPRPQSPFACTAPVPANAVQLVPDLTKPDATDSPVPFDRQPPPLPDSNEPLSAAPQSLGDQADLAGIIAIPLQNMATPAPSALVHAQTQAKPADSPTVPLRPNATATPLHATALPDTIAPLAMLPTQPAEPVPPAGTPLQADVQNLPNRTSTLPETDQPAQPVSQTSPLDALNRSASNQPPMAIAGPMATNLLPHPSADAPASQDTAPANTTIPTPSAVPKIAQTSTDLAHPKGAEHAAAPLSSLPGFAHSTSSPEQASQSMPARALTPPTSMTDPCALAFAEALSAYKASESHPSAAIVQTPLANSLRATSLNTRSTTPQADLKVPFPADHDLVATSPKTIPALAALTAVPAPTTVQTSPDSDARPITALVQPILKELPPDTPTPAPPTEIAKPAITERQAFANSIPIPSHANPNTLPPTLTTTALQSPVPMPALIQHIRQHAALGKPTASELSLAPEELGKLRILMTPDGDKLRIVIQAERPETLELIRRNSESFTADLRQSGFAGTSFSFGGWGDQSPPQQAKNQDAAAHPFGINGEIAVPPKPNARSLKTSGLDLRV